MVYIKLEFLLDETLLEDALDILADHVGDQKGLPYGKIIELDGEEAKIVMREAEEDEELNLIENELEFSSLPISFPTFNLD